MQVALTLILFMKHMSFLIYIFFQKKETKCSKIYSEGM